MIALCPTIGGGKLDTPETFMIVCVVISFLIEELLQSLIALRIFVMLRNILNRVEQICSLPERDEDQYVIL